VYVFLHAFGAGTPLGTVNNLQQDPAYVDIFVYVYSNTDQMDDGLNEIVLVDMQHSTLNNRLASLQAIIANVLGYPLGT